MRQWPAEEARESAELIGTKLQESNGGRNKKAFYVCVSDSLALSLAVYLLSEMILIIEVCVKLQLIYFLKANNQRWKHI